MDYSFIRFKDSFASAKDIGDSPTATHIYHMVQLSPNEAYCQITNVDGGISFSGMYEAHIVDCNNVALKDITDNTFIEEFTGIDATQCNIEFVNLGTDYYRKTVFIRLSATDSDLVYWSNPLNITDYQINQSSYFQYKNYDDFNGISYTNSGVWQSIRLRTYFDIPVDSSEITDYYQISRQNTVSARALIKKFEQYQLDYINRFTYDRLNLLLKHELIYIDGVRVTNKTTIESQNREGDGNFFISNFQVCKNYADTLEYEYQVFTGLQYVSFAPIGAYAICYISSEGSITFNQNIELQTGTVAIYDSSDNSLIDTFTENDISIVDNVLNISGFNNNITVNGNYYVNISEGLVSYLSVENEAIQDAVTWTFDIVTGMYDNTQYDSNNYLIGCPDDGIFSDEFGTEFS